MNTDLEIQEIIKKNLPQQVGDVLKVRLEQAEKDANLVVQLQNIISKMEYKDFFEASISLQNFIKEQDKLNDVLKVISPSSTSVCEFGNTFIDDYIRVVEIALGDTNQWFAWFAFDNDFGKNRMVVKVNDKAYKICDEKQFYDVLDILCLTLI